MMLGRHLKTEYLDLRVWASINLASERGRPSSTALGRKPSHSLQVCGVPGWAEQLWPYMFPIVVVVVVVALCLWLWLQLL